MTVIKIVPLKTLKVGKGTFNCYIDKGTLKVPKELTEIIPENEAEHFLAYIRHFRESVSNALGWSAEEGDLATKELIAILSSVVPDIPEEYVPTTRAYEVIRNREDAIDVGKELVETLQQGTKGTS